MNPISPPLADDRHARSIDRPHLRRGRCRRRRRVRDPSRCRIGRVGDTTASGRCVAAEAAAGR
ncbi:hypothetical protein [Lysobacter gummosus]|uniref:hypothetical protein n=1 Tax=Lysobacter gummosus TaxID=262324 RepID=UPI0036320573